MYLYAALIGTSRNTSQLRVEKGPRELVYSGAYSTTPPASILPLLTVSPLARNKSSTVLSFPSSVLSLNQPRWSAMRCLRFACMGYGSARGLERCSPVFASRTCHKYNPLLITPLRKLVCRAGSTSLRCTCESQRQLRLGGLKGYALLWCRGCRCRYLGG